jgi:hypothetical protein
MAIFSTVTRVARRYQAEAGRGVAPSARQHPLDPLEGGHDDRQAVGETALAMS